MIIGSDKAREIHGVYTGLCDAVLRYHSDQPYAVLRPATADEWIEQLLAEGYTRAYAEGICQRAPHAYFYEISVD